MSKNITSLSISIFLILFPLSHAQSIDLISGSQVLECAITLIERYPINETTIGILGSVVRSLQHGLKSKSEVLPLTEPAIPAINNLRTALNHGTLTEKTQYVSFTHEDSDKNKHLTYGKITKITTSQPIKTAEDIEVHIEPLDGEEEILLTGSSLHSITVSKRSKQAFEQKKSLGFAHFNPKVTIGQSILIPRPAGGFKSGIIDSFIGDQVIVSLESFNGSEPEAISVSIDSIKPQLQPGNEVSVRLADNFVVFAVIKDTPDNGRVQVETSVGKRLHKEVSLRDITHIHASSSVIYSSY